VYIYIHVSCYCLLDTGTIEEPPWKKTAAFMALVLERSFLVQRNSHILGVLFLQEINWNVFGCI
jgi:hypothetical protein